MEITDEQVNIWARQSIESARNPFNEWDKKAIDWPHLNEDSVVFEVGAYKGRWAYQIATRYNPRLFCFEPQGWCCEVLSRVLKGTQAKIYRYALGSIRGIGVLSKSGTDGATLLISESQSHTQDVLLWEIGEALFDLSIDNIDLMLMNIEGYEYALLPHMVSNEIFPDILMVQFHDDFGDTLGMMELLDGHYRERVFDYGSTLTAWRR